MTVISATKNYSIPVYRTISYQYFTRGHVLDSEKQRVSTQNAAIGILLRTGNMV